MKEQMVSGKTRLCGIIGDPVEHSMSPVMHNAAFREAGIDYLYVPFRVKQEELGKAIAGMRALNIRGLNVTIHIRLPSCSSWTSWMAWRRR